MVPLAFTAAHAQFPDTEQDKTFLMNASEGGMAEIQLGQLASEKAQNPKVKAFGRKMVRDHTRLSNELLPFATKDGVPPPTGLTPDDKAEWQKLNGLSGADFDKEYVAFMMKDHQHDQMAFQQEASSTQDGLLKMTVQKGLKVVEMHRAMVDKLGAKMDVQSAKLENAPATSTDNAGK